MRDSSVARGQPPISGEELERMHPLGRCELVRGRIVRASPTSPRHGRIEGNFCYRLRAFVEPRGLGTVLVGEVGIYTGRDPDTVRGADVVFLSNERRAKCWGEAGFLEVPPDLVVEVLSPSESRAELEEKVAEYVSLGVRLVWVADPESRTVRAHRSLDDVRVFREDDILKADDLLPGFEVEVRRLLDD